MVLRRCHTSRPQAWHGGSDAVVRGLDQLHPRPAELAAAERLIQRAHAQGRRVRFWGTLDTPQQWQVRRLHPAKFHAHTLSWRMCGTAWGLCD